LGFEAQPNLQGEILLKNELAAWQQERNQEHAKVKWQFTTADARIKLHHLYPQF